MHATPDASPPLVRMCRWAGLVCLALGSLLLLQQLWFVAHARRAQGTVLRYSSVRRMSGRPPLFNVSFSYVLPDGRTVEVTSHTPLNSVNDAGRVGGPVPVLFNPAHPEQAVPNLWMELWFAPVLLLGTGAFLLVLAAILAYGSARVFPVQSRKRLAPRDQYPRIS